MLRPVIAEELGHALRNGSCQLDLVNAEVCTLKQSDGGLGERQDVKAPVVAEERQQRLEVEMVADGDLFFKSGRQVIGGKHILGAKERQSIAWMKPERFIVYQSLDRL